MRTPRSVAVIITAAVVALVVAAPTGVGLAAYYHDKKQLKVLPSHTEGGGVDVSHLDRAHAIAKVRSIVDARLDRTATLMVGDARYTTTLRRLGVHDDVAPAVDQALSSNHTGSWLSRTWHRVFGGQTHPTLTVALSKPSKAKLQQLVDRAAKAVT